MMSTLLREEQFPTSVKKELSFAEKVSANAVKELSQKPCGEALFCEKGMLCNGICCIPSVSER